MWNLQNLLETITGITKPGTWRLGKARIKERLLIYAQPLCLPFKFVLLNAHYSVMWGVRRKKSSFLTSPGQLVTNQSEKTHVMGRWEHLLLVLVTLEARTWAQGSLSHCPEWWAMGLNPHTTREGCTLPFFNECSSWPNSEFLPDRQAYGDIQCCSAPLHQWTRPQPSGLSRKTEARAIPHCTGMLWGQTSPLQTHCNMLG